MELVGTYSFSEDFANKISPALNSAYSDKASQHTRSFTLEYNIMS